MIECSSFVQCIVFTAVTHNFRVEPAVCDEKRKLAHPADEAMILPGDAFIEQLLTTSVAIHSSSSK
jgi:hypothetical protein